MRITELLGESAINVALQGKNKDQIIDELVDLLNNSGKLTNREEFKQAIWAREKQVSTGSENGLAVPHAKSATVKQAAVAFGLSTSGVDYEAIDNKPSRLFFMIAVPEGGSALHLEVLARLTTLLMNPELKMALLRAKSSKDVMEALNEHEAAYLKKEKEQVPSGNAKILAVTACPVGIAHTYMAADALNTKAKDLGIDIKVETNGSSGVKNELTSKDIAGAEIIIVAADKKVSMKRFEGKKLIQVPVTQAMKNPEGLLKDAIAGKGSIYHDAGNQNEDPDTMESASFYRHLMNGVSNMLPFVIAGGILIALSFMFGINAASPDDPSYNPFAKLLMDLGGGSGAFALLIPVLAGFIGMSIGDRPGFMPAMVGGLMAANSGAGFLGGLVAGFLGGYVANFLKKLTSKMPEILDSIKPILIFPVLGLLITGGIMTGVLDWVVALNNWLTGHLNSLSGGNLVVMGFILAAMMAVDMGGPVNKVAFTFGVAALQAGNQAPHAAIMAGGMVPPLAIALATTFFKNKFNESERRSGMVNYIMGASFITEGAIPFAAADPLRVLPACILGSGIAGALAMAFGCLLPAPHGGLFVLLLIKNWPLYLIAVLTGSIVAGAIIGMTKKRLV